MELGVSVPWLRPDPGPYLGPFRTNIQEFLSVYGSRVPLGRYMKKITAWIVHLQADNGCKVLLHVYEERFTEEKDTQPSCDCCRNMGELVPLAARAFRAQSTLPRRMAKSSRM